MGQLDGKVALITGAGGGIGGAIARLFAAEGARLCLADRRNDALDGMTGRLGLPDEWLLAVACDVTDEAEMGRLAMRCEARLGGIDILVNSSGAISERALQDMPLAEWNAILGANLTAVFIACRAVLPVMERRGGGRIINIASQIGQKGAPRFSHYAAAKAGVIALTKSLAKEVARSNILVNAIAPGPVLTAFNAGLAPETLAGTAALLPLGRAAEPFEIAPTALLLASSPGGDVYVGQTLGPNSGDVML